LTSRSLFERLKHPQLESRRTAEGSLEEMVEDILRHLRQMLNSRQGSALTALDYGVPDLTESLRQFPASRGDIEEALRVSIEKYEPRLRDVTVSFSEDEDVLVLRFEVRARVATSDDDAGVWFLTRIDSDGRIDVTG